MFADLRWLMVPFALAIALAGAEATLAQETSITPAQEAFFEKNIRPAFAKYCYECHSVESGTTRGGLLVDTREGLLNGGDSGAAISPGDLDGSLLWESINWDGYEMPPSQKMPDAVIAHFKQWIQMGAPDPRVRERATFNSKMTADFIDAGKKHWAFQPPAHSAATGSIDSHIASKLKSQGLTAVGPADALTLLRRLNFDLIGLPPTVAEIQSFQAAWNRNRSQAIETKVDELLARSQFGERWGRHWLDVARYADTSGNINVAYPQAWRYRDYVIDSFNNDTPYDQFIREQIAGDLLPAKTDEEWQKNLIATGFLAVGMKRHDERNPKKFMMDMVDEQIDTITQGILGMTVACARCHDHKSDPIPTADYYSLAGIFLSTRTLYGTVWGQQNHRPSDLLLLPILDRDAGASGPSIAELKQQLARLQTEYQRMNAEARASGERVQRNFVSMRNRMSQIEGMLAKKNPDGTSKTFGMGVQESDRMVNASILVGGEVERPAQEVTRGFLQVLDSVRVGSIAEDSSGRRELAQWLTSKDNPLTARVMANRVWAHLFGTPIVATPNNWGPAGLNPTHPELLDYLAVRLMDEGWSIKTLIREIVLSETYQRSSQFNARNADVDPDNKLFWRMSPRQMDAEVMRDAMLAVGGTLDLRRPRSKVADWGDGRVDRGAGSDARVNETNNYRSVYLPVIRDTVNESLDLFGFPDPNITSSGRRASIAPTQALYIMNGDFAIGQARAMAAAMQQQSSRLSDQIGWAFLTAYGRPATSAEVQASLRFLNNVKISASDSGSAAFTGRPGNRARPGVDGDRRPAGRHAGRMQGGRPNDMRPNDMRPSGMGTGGARTGGMRPGNRPAARPSRPDQTAEQQKLTLFCQALLASADFRIIN